MTHIKYEEGEEHQDKPQDQNTTRTISRRRGGIKRKEDGESGSDDEEVGTTGGETTDKEGARMAKSKNKRTNYRGKNTKLKQARWKNNAENAQRRTWRETKPSKK